jgi:hypothetical protein
MKLLVLIFLGLTSSWTWAQGEPFLVKVNGGGYIPEEWARSEKCEIYLDKAVLTLSFGKEVRLAREYALNFEGSIQKVLKMATREQVFETPNNICDAPTTHAYGVTEAGPFTIFSSGGCGEKKRRRQGPNSQTLYDIFSQICPKFHDY